MAAEPLRRIEVVPPYTADQDPGALVVAALDELDQACGLLEDLRAHLRDGHPIEGAALIVSRLTTRLGVVSCRVQKALIAAGAPTRWRP